MGLVFDYFIDFGWALGGGEGCIKPKIQVLKQITMQLTY
jgi:hypothetical protein